MAFEQRHSLIFWWGLAAMTLCFAAGCSNKLERFARAYVPNVERSNVMPMGNSDRAENMTEAPRAGISASMDPSDGSAGDVLSAVGTIGGDEATVARGGAGGDEATGTGDGTGGAEIAHTAGTVGGDERTDTGGMADADANGNGGAGGYR